MFLRSWLYGLNTWYEAKRTESDVAKKTVHVAINDCYLSIITWQSIFFFVHLRLGHFNPYVYSEFVYLYSCISGAAEQVRQTR